MDRPQRSLPNADLRGQLLQASFVDHARGEGGVEFVLETQKLVPSVLASALISAP